MKRITTLLISLLLIGMLVVGGAHAKIVTEQFLKNPSFDSGGGNWSVARYHDYQGYYVGCVFQNGEAYFWTHSHYGEGVEYAYAYIYQYLTLPDINSTLIKSATLSMKYYNSLYSQSLRIYLDISGTKQYFPTTRGKWEIGTMNITSFVKKYVGKRVEVKAGWSSGWASGHFYIDWVYLNITYNKQSSSGGSGGWWGGGGWSGGGGSWSGGGGSWWGGGSSWHGGGGFFGILGGWFGHTGAVNQTYVEYEVERMQELLSITGGIIISILWVNVAVNYFSSDPDKKKKAKEKSLNAFVGTIIVAIAVLGAMWIIAGWLVGAW
ncbi:hypothetical protein [Candidatus Aciduliprofundum boonei]|uniref:Uncharacterized protein n=1 Tax=Aciduliprofundum boonei (strain DSM 19572 / T469) TaxID=439481 RepID=D3T9U1_ACIB4|nr:hypothetical protein [Candidatus Aciduliprofundum boonei]ADD08870.1 hypothetical protein Aboo_1061 [Aciduliprofundum boonei T469]HII55623.1 hypothetical protein [Candidatus Aciduliprofundum boonei]